MEQKLAKFRESKQKQKQGSLFSNLINQLPKVNNVGVASSESEVGLGSYLIYVCYLWSNL